VARGENRLYPYCHPCEVPVARLVRRVVFLTCASPFVGSMAAFLASSESDYATGATFFVDGGLTWNYQEQ